VIEIHGEIDRKARARMSHPLSFLTSYANPIPRPSLAPDVRDARLRRASFCAAG
jgi:hypothetical protein